MNSFNIFHNKDEIPFWVLTILGIIFSIGFVFISTVWCVYYIYHALKVKRKIKALKWYTEHLDKERYINAVIEYKKSIFIAIISFLESWLGIVYWGVISFAILYNDPNNSTLPSFSYYMEKHPTFDILVIGFLSLFILMGSLVCILTSYLTKAYGTGRETKLNEKQLFAWMFLQLFIGWIVCLIPEIREIGLPVYTLCIFIGQIVVYARLSNRLYSVLRARREDSYFEDLTMHSRLVIMCRNFKYGAIAYTVVLVFFLSELITEIVGYYFAVLFLDDHFLHEYLDPSDILRKHHLNTLNQIKLCIACIAKITAMLMVLFSFMVHLTVVFWIILSSFERKRNIKYQIKCANDVLNTPLLGDK